MPKVIDLTDDTLEDLLTYDDLFLEYFNAFLALPVFPQPLHYNRLTGTVLEVRGSVNALSGEQSRASTPPYGATDEEREKMLQWLKEERLPVFLRTQLFQELKLCKLLLRPLDDHYSAGRHSSRTIRGYSRQEDSYVSSLSNSNAPDDQDLDFDDERVPWDDHRISALYRYRRPGSRAYSLPTRLGLAYVPSQSASRAARVRDENSQLDSRSVSSAGSKPNAKGTAVQFVTSTNLMSDSDTGPPRTGPPITDQLQRESTFFIEQQTAKPEIDPMFCIQEADGKTVTSSSAHVRNAQSFSSTTKNYSTSKSATDSRDTTKLDNLTVAQPGSKSVQQPPRPSNEGRPLSRGSPKFQNTPFDANHPLPKELAPSNFTATSEIALEDHKSVTYSDYDIAYDQEETGSNTGSGREMVAFQPDAADDQTDAGLSVLMEKNSQSFQSMKQSILGRLSGMTQFRGFLLDTPGHHLLEFWLDSETFKDCLEDLDEEDTLAIRNHLFRDMQDKYRLTLTAQARRQVMQGATFGRVSHKMFIRVQYDVLRRLRAYWLPRFLLHMHSNIIPAVTNGRTEKEPGIMTEPKTKEEKRSVAMFPSICLANSMPVRPDDLLHIAQTTNWDMVSKSGRRLDERVKSGRAVSRAKTVTQNIREKLLFALTRDKAAGGPFKMFLDRHRDYEMLSNLQFWEDVEAYAEAEDRAADRLVRMGHAWAIYNTYMSVHATYPIGISAITRDCLHKTLLTSQDFVDVSVFKPSKEYAVASLERLWIRYLKEDMKAFIDCHMRPLESPPSTADEIEVTLDDNDFHLIVRRPRPWTQRYPPSTHSERGQRLRTALSMADSIDEAKKLELRQRARERRAEQEKERKKAIKAARRRQKEARMKKNVSFRRSSTDGSEISGDGDRSGAASASNATDTGLSSIADEDTETEGGDGAKFIGSVSNRALMGMFKKYLTESENKEIINIMNLYMDIEQYNSLEKTAKGKRDTQAAFICKTYIEQGARKKVLLSDKAYNRMKSERERPKSPTLLEIQQHLEPQLETTFRRFWKAQQEEMGMGGKDMVTMSKAELALRSDNDAALMNWKAKKGKGGKKDGRSQPSREDKTELLVMLGQASAGHFPLKVLYFYKYLVEHGEQDGMPQIDRDLFFYCECQKFKDASHIYSDEDLLMKKVKSLTDCFLESSTPPALQVDLAADVHQRTMRASQKYTSGKDVLPSIFDEAQYEVFKELLPYWAGFNKHYKPPEDVTKRVLTDREVARANRLADFNKYRIPPIKRVVLPEIPHGTSIAAFSWSLNDGIKWREVHEVEDPMMQMAMSPSRATLMTTSQGHIERRSPSSTMIPQI